MLKAVEKVLNRPNPVHPLADRFLAHCVNLVLTPPPPRVRKRPQMA
jgi:hypothetical protein